MVSKKVALTALAQQLPDVGATRRVDGLTQRVDPVLGGPSEGRDFRNIFYHVNARTRA